MKKKINVAHANLKTPLTIQYVMRHPNKGNVLSLPFLLLPLQVLPLPNAGKIFPVKWKICNCGHLQGE